MPYLIGYHNNNPDVQEMYALVEYPAVNGAVVLLSTVLSAEGCLQLERYPVQVSRRSSTGEIEVVCSSYPGDGVCFTFSEDGKRGRFHTGLHAYSSGGSGILEPALLKAAIDFILKKTKHPCGMV